MIFKTYIIKKIQGLVGVHFAFGNNRSNYLKIFRENYTFLDLKADEIYNITVGNIKRILLTYLLA